MPIPRAIEGVAWEDTGPTLLARIKNNSGVDIEQADLTSIFFKVTDRLGEEVDSGSVSIPASIFDTLQTDDLWTVDSVGYNFRYVMDKSQIPSPGEYRVDFKFAPTEGEQFFAVFKLKVNKTYE